MPSETIPSPSRARRSGCPGCGQVSAAAYRPFCSRGCRDRDLLQWFDEGHRIPGRPAVQDEDEA